MAWHPLLSRWPWTADCQCCKELWPVCKNGFWSRSSKAIVGFKVELCMHADHFAENIFCKSFCLNSFKIFCEWMHAEQNSYVSLPSSKKVYFTLSIQCFLLSAKRSACLSESTLKPTTEAIHTIFTPLKYHVMDCKFNCKIDNFQFFFCNSWFCGLPICNYII